MRTNPSLSEPHFRQAWTIRWTPPYLRSVILGDVSELNSAPTDEESSWTSFRRPRYMTGHATRRRRIRRVHQALSPSPPLFESIMNATAAAMTHFPALLVSTAPALIDVEPGVPPCWSKEVYTCAELFYTLIHARTPEYITSAPRPVSSTSGKPSSTRGWTTSRPRNTAFRR